MSGATLRILWAHRSRHNLSDGFGACCQNDLDEKFDLHVAEQSAENVLL